MEAQSMSSTHSDTSCSRSAVKVEVSAQEGGETKKKKTSLSMILRASATITLIPKPDKHTTENEKKKIIDYYF